MQVKALIILVIVSLLAITPILAQDTPPIPDNVDTSAITDDDVNEIAHQLYCPVCENIPLDTCGTAACDDWREEIRAMLATGMPEEDIIDNFVVRFGDRVVSSPRDPIIAAISTATPWLVLLFACALAVYQLLQWRGKRKVAEPSTTTDKVSAERNRYLEQLEKDLAGK